jgi:gliding motility-associated-like protein
MIRANLPFIDKSFPETDLTNNTTSFVIIPFAVTANPSDTAILRSTSLQLEAFVTGEPLGSLKWEPAQYLSCTNCLTPVASPPSTMTYTVIAQNERSCTDTAYITIKTFTAGDKVNIPNAFTPNRDGKNDVFYILGTNDVQLVRNFQIFDRWGQEIFKTSNTAANDPNYGWKGTVSSGKEANSGTYVYVVTIEFKDGHTEVFKGTVILVR